ncbi:MAG TPA: choice-of-anchor Q domain-containing protein, partial [Anaerolineaceae bacterium]
MPPRRHLARLLDLVLIVILLAGAFGVHPAIAQVDPPTGKPTPGPESLTYAYNPDNGRLAFISGSADAPLIAPDQMLGALTDVDAGALALAQYAEAFGITNPAEELRLERVDDRAGGATLRYQQQYDGIPVLGGELLLNRDALGRLLSLNGEISPGLRLPTTRPAISAARARNTAIAGMKSWYRLSASQAQAAEPALWIYDPAIFGPSDAKPVLTWRVDVRATGGSAPVDELVLVNATTGRVALHFNQINASLPAQEEPQDPTPTTEPPVEEPQAVEPTAEPVETEPVEPLPEEAQGQADEAVRTQSTENGLYISPDGDDQPGGAANDCRDPAAPCRTIAHAYELAEAGATILAQSGPYEGNLMILKNLSLSGGWDSTFTSQRGQSAIISDGYWADYGFHITTNITVQIRNFTISGMTDRYAVSNHGTLDISNCVLTNNAGALLSEESGSLTVTNCVISNNHTGLYISYQNSVTISNTTIADNTGYGLRLFFLDTTSAVIRGSIIARNETPSKFIRGKLVSGGYNIFDLDKPFYDELNIDKGVFVTDPTDRMGVDPQISALIDNRHYALAATSPAIDALGTQVPCPSMDIRGIDRPVNGICDIGAFEYQPAGAVERLLPVPAPAFVTAPEMQFPYLAEVTAVDALGNLAQGVPVTFTAPESGASAVLVKSATPHTVSVSSGPDGVARPPLLLANSIFGSYTLSATANGVAPVDFTMGNGTPARYVDPERGDDGENRNMCLDPAAPCRSLDQALTVAAPSDLILLASGVYSQVTPWYNIANVQKDVVLSGGWNSSFTQRSGRSQLNGGGMHVGLEIEKDVYALVDRVDAVDLDWGFVMKKGQVIWTNSQFSDNNGGIWNLATLRMENVSITHNLMGIRNAGDLQITNATISRNVCFEGNSLTYFCPSNTAGLENVKQATATLTHVTLADNRVMIRNTDDYWWEEVAGGIENPSGTVNLRSSIVALNQNNRGADCKGTIHSLGDNIIGNASACTLTPADGDYIGSRENPLNPLLGRLGDYGGETLTVPL